MKVNLTCIKISLNLDQIFLFEGEHGHHVVLLFQVVGVDVPIWPDQVAAWVELGVLGLWKVLLHD